MTRWLEMFVWWWIGGTLCLRCGDCWIGWRKHTACRRCRRVFASGESIELGEALRRRERPQWYP